MHAREMLATHPQVHGGNTDALLRCIEECYACAQACTSCADACLGEEQVSMLVQCIRRNLDCADLCLAAGAVATRRTGTNAEVLRAALSACGEACRTCAEECARHAEMHEHCRICAEACRSCADACRDALQQVH